MEKKGLTELKDLDKEILLKMGDREFIQTCMINKYFKSLCDSSDYLLYKKRLELYYPDTLKDAYMQKSSNWKKYYARVVKMIAVLEEKYDYTYTKGDLVKEYFYMINIYKRSRNHYNKLLTRVLNDRYFNPSFLKYILKNGANISWWHMDVPAINGDLETLKFLIDNGGNPDSLKFSFQKFSPEIQNYLKTLGV